MYKLLVGVDQFQRNGFPKRRDLFSKLSQGQNPLALFITCSDSRIDPNLITSTDPGDLFVLRNAGNLVPAYNEGLGEAATIEYAVKALRVQDIVVCGHTCCGAMAAVLRPETCEGVPAVASWIKKASSVRQRVREKYGEVAEDQLLDLVIQENVLSQLENLQTHPAVAEGVSARSLNLHGWVYSIRSGEVLRFDPQDDTFVPCVSQLDATISSHADA